MATKTNIERPNRSCIGKLLNDQRANRQGARKLRQKSDAPQSTSPHGEERGAAARLEPWPGTPKLGRNAMLAVRTLRPRLRGGKLCAPYDSACRGRVEERRGDLGPCGHRSVSAPRSSNRTCGFPASGSPTGFIARPTTEVARLAWHAN